MKLTPRERMLALVQGRELDRVPFVIYNGVLPSDEVIAHLGAERVGRLIWCRVHRVEHPHCHFDFEEYFIGESKWRRNTLHTPGGVLTEERAYEPAYGTSSIDRLAARLFGAAAPVQAGSHRLSHLRGWVGSAGRGKCRPL